MERLLYFAVRSIVLLIQALPLPWVAQLGRIGGALAYHLDRRHRRVALRNLEQAFQFEKSGAEIRAIARENFRRIGENYCCAVKTAAMDWTELEPFCQFASIDQVFPPGAALPRNLVAAIGHFGNFELYARFGQFFPQFQCATTYRGLRQPSLDQLLQSLRAKSGCLFFERRTDAAALKAAMNRSGIILGLLSDQHAGKGGLWLPFFQRICSTTAAPAVFASRYDCPLFTGFCYRVGLGRWRIEVGPLIPTHLNGKPRSPTEITLDINRAFEQAIRKDPANWFWVHQRWKPNPPPIAKRPLKPVDLAHD